MTAKHYEIILYAEDGWTPKKILAVLMAWTIVSIYAFILHDRDMEEDGSFKKAHYHVYLNFGKSSTSIQSTARRFGIAEHLVQKIKTDKYRTLQYFLHSGAEGKQEYQMSQMVANFDVQEFFDNYNRKKTVDRILEECAAGIITRASFIDYIPGIIYSRYRYEIENALTYADKKYLAMQDEVDIPVIWVYGSSGTGKSTICKLVSTEKGFAYFITANGNDPFSEYQDQQSIILDELRPMEQYTYVDLLKILDPHTVSAAHARYHDKVLKPQMIFITSLYSPEEYYEAMYLPKTESAVQLYRRLREVWHVEAQTITISHYDMKTGRFVETGSKSNPVPAYLASLAAKQNQSTQLSGSSLLDDISKKYQAATATPPSAPAGGTPSDDTEKEILPFPDTPEQEDVGEPLSLFDDAS